MRVRAITLLEVIAALVVLGLIAAVGARVIPEVISLNSSNEAETTLSRAVLAQSAYAGRHGQYTTSGDALTALKTGRGLTLTTGPSTDPDTVSAHHADDGTILLAVRSAEGRCIATLLGDPLTDPSQEAQPVVTKSACLAEALRP